MWFNKGLFESENKLNKRIQTIDSLFSFYNYNESLQDSSEIIELNKDLFFT